MLPAHFTIFDFDLCEALNRRPDILWIKMLKILQSHHLHPPSDYLTSIRTERLLASIRIKTGWLTIHLEPDLDHFKRRLFALSL